MPEENPLHLCANEKPELYQAVHLYFEDERETTGYWTGRFWWTYGHGAEPLFWQNIESHWMGSQHGQPGLKGSRN